MIRLMTMQKHSSELNYARSSVYSLQYHLIPVFLDLATIWQRQRHRDQH